MCGGVITSGHAHHPIASLTKDVAEDELKAAELKGFLDWMLLATSDRIYATAYSSYFASALRFRLATAPPATDGGVRPECRSHLLDIPVAAATVGWNVGLVELVVIFAGFACAGLALVRAGLALVRAPQLKPFRRALGGLYEVVRERERGL